MIRRGTEADVPGLVALEAELFGVAAWTERLVREEVERVSLLLADGEGGTPSGYLVTRTAGDVADLLRIGVRPDHQRRGLGGILLRAALEEAAGAERMMLEVSDRNDAAVALYRGHGFEVVDRRRRYYPDGSDALVMSRDLS